MKKELTTTDWDSYYGKTYKITSFTRKTTENLLIKLLSIYGENLKTKHIAELGGANSCFYDAIKTKIKPAKFHVIDNNQKGLDLFQERTKDDAITSFENIDVLKMTTAEKYDIVFSIGLIEHFNRVQTAKAIQAHFNAVKEGGLVIISFPTPTWLYRLARKISEIIGIWYFFDERPLKFQEVLMETQKHGDLLFSTINWKVILTQGFVVIRKHH